MKGEHKPGYRRPRKGEKRAVDQPFKLDRLPQEVRDAILTARNQDGKTWEETAEIASKVAGRPISATSVRRWYDVRVAQVNAEVMKEAEASRVIAAEFAAMGFEKLPAATMNALSGEVFNIAKAKNSAERQAALSNLAFLLSKMITAEAGRDKLEIEKRKVKLAEQKLDAVRAKLSGVKDAVAGGKKKVSREELAKKLDEIYGLTKTNA